MRKFLILLKKVSERPGMYLGQADMKLVRAWYSGYLDAFEHENPKDKTSLRVFGGFPYWVYWKYSSDNTGWEETLARVAGSDANAVNGLYDMFQAYLKDVRSRKFDPENPPEKLP